MATDQLAADEVAEDFRASLADLTTNDRYQINNFTVIARENTEYASEISNALIEHIGKAKPDHKLPALYVLDSIAKNIGSPYTLFLAYRLYTTFMNAYSSVDKPTRRKLDEMLKTWQMPVPNSLDTRPVFPPEVTGKMVNALQQSTARATQFEQQQREQEMLRRRRIAATTGASSTGWRETPTPPQTSSRYTAPLPQGYPNGQTFSPYPPSNQFPQPIPQQQYMPNNTASHYPPSTNSAILDELHHDVENLIKGVKEDLILNLNNKDIQIKLKALLDLQQVLRSQQLAPAALQNVRDQVRALQMIQPPRPLPPQTTLSLPIPASLPPTPIAPQNTPYNAAIPMQYAPPPPQVAAPTISTNLADLLVSMQKNTPALPPQISTPQLSTSTLAMAPLVAPPPSAPPAENPLFAQLRAAGLLSSNTPTIPNTVPVVKNPPAQTGPINLADLLKSVAPKPPAVSSVPSVERIELTSASLKIPRPNLISKLYEARPNQCTSCGKRFLATEEGKTEKAKHLDWHFRTNQRLTEAAQRGLSRSWYVDELEWIKFREAGDEAGYGSADNPEDPSLLGPNSRKDDPRNRYVRVPSDKTLASAPCPICQEKFEVTWNEDLQDFVWMDAIKVGGRIFHASCYTEMKKDGDITPARTATPDSVLGKRKAETSAEPSPNKMVRESIG